MSINTCIASISEIVIKAPFCRGKCQILEAVGLFPYSTRVFLLYKRLDLVLLDHLLLPIRADEASLAHAAFQDGFILFVGVAIVFEFPEITYYAAKIVICV